MPQTATGLPREKKRTQAITLRLPRGLSIGKFNDGRAREHFVRFGPERRIETFTDEGARNDRAEQLIEIRENDGKKALNEINPAEWREYLAFRSRVKAPLSEIEAVWNLSPHGGHSQGILVSKAVNDYLAFRESEGVKEGTDTHRHLVLHLRTRLAGAYGHLSLAELTTERLRFWLDSLIDPKTKRAMSNLTKRHHRKDVVTFLKRAVREKWVGENAATNITPPQLEQKDVSVLPVAQGFQLLKRNLGRPIAPKLALEMFGFLRCSSVERIKKEHVNFEDRGILMPGQIHKSGKRKFRQGHPGVLWDWLSVATDETWLTIREANYDFEKVKAFARADIENPGNVLRHSCISYHLAALKNPPLTSYIAQHSNLKTTSIYEGAVTERDANLWLALTPAAIAAAPTFEDFLSSTTTTVTTAPAHGLNRSNPSAA